VALTLNDIKPIGLCITTQELFDTKRFLYNYCDGLILRSKDSNLVNDLTAFKRELNSLRTQIKYLAGFKAIVTSNIDKIPNNFEDILAMENEFKSKITLPVYELFIKSLKRSKINII